uniref:Uncharacterized protein n=1 Tax=Molossus molossus TaxID=27622 RepID=A0A7J8E2V6_MOLMO|nr:hypothetical protein HJG59_008970 [Molossus molossus]
MGLESLTKPGLVYEDCYTIMTTARLREHLLGGRRQASAPSPCTWTYDPILQGGCQAERTSPHSLGKGGFVRGHHSHWECYKEEVPSGPHVVRQCNGTMSQEAAGFSLFLLRQSFGARPHLHPWEELCAGISRGKGDPDPGQLQRVRGI